MKFLIPEFYKKFNCIGSECEETCCQIWKVYIDKKTYLKYKNYKGDKEIEVLLKKHIKRNRQSNSDFSYAKLIMDENNMCPFLDSNNLCSIYTKLGEDYMGLTCKLYPRIFAETIGFREKGLSTSCPEVIRVGLLNKERMEFEVVESDSGEFMKDYDFNNYSKREKDIFWPLRNFSITLVQNREYNLDERLIILAIVINKLDILIKERNYNEIESKINYYQNLIDNNQFRDVLKNFNVNRIFQINFMDEIFRIIQVETRAYKICEEIYRESLDIFALKDVSEEEELLHYEEIYKTYYKKFMDEKSHILENYIINNMFNTKFPYSETFTTEVFNNLFMIIIRYLVLKFNLVAASKKYGEKLDDSKIVEIIYKLSKIIEHNSVVIAKIINQLESDNLKDIAHMIALIKD